MTFTTPPDITPGGSDWDRYDRALSDLADIMGWESWEDIVIFGNFEAVPADEIRPGIYSTPEDALFNAFDVGILEYVTLLYDGDQKAWVLVVHYVAPNA